MKLSLRDSKCVVVISIIGELVSRTTIVSVEVPHRLENKQNVLARPNIESEIRGVTQGICELLWLKIVFDDLKISMKAL